MRFQLLAVVLATTLAACAAAGTDGSSSSASSDSEGVSSDGGIAADGSTATDGGAAGDASSDASTIDAGPAVATYAQEAPVLDEHCATCHNSQFATLASLKADRSKIVKELSQQKMPKDDPSWAASADGLQLLNFMKNSPELN